MTKLTGLASEIFLDKYAAAGETEWSHCAKRVARHVSQAENGNQIEWQEKFFNAINNMEFIPGGRILFGAGRPRQSLLNCFALQFQDNRESLGEGLKNVYLISCEGGGIGFNFSAIRPRGDTIQNIKFSAPGTVSEMRKIDIVGQEVKGGKNRRSALLAVLNVGHPDILDFLHVKLDLKQLSNFNISVGITDEFIKAVEKNKEWTFQFNNKTYYVYEVDRIYRNGRSETIKVTALNEEDALGRAYNGYKKNSSDKFDNPRQITFKAKELWNTIIENSKKCGDPGIFNLSMVNRYTNVSYFERMDQPNPCTTGDTLVATPYGYKRADEFKRGDEILCTYNKRGKVSTVEKHDACDVYLVKTSDGGEIKVTEAHQFHAIKKGGKTGFYEHICLKDLLPGDKIRLQPVEIVGTSNPLVGKYVMMPNISERDVGFMVGTLIGDGCYTQNAMDSNHVKISTHIDEDGWNNAIIKTFDKADMKLTLHHDGKTQKSRGGNLTSSKLSNIVNDLQLEPAYSYEKRIPLHLINSHMIVRLGILDGLISTDGNINLNSKTPCIRITSSSLELLRDVRLILMSLGCTCGIYLCDKAGSQHDFHGRIIKRQHDRYDLNIFGDSLGKLSQILTLSHPDKEEKLSKIRQFAAAQGNNERTEIKSIEHIGKESVYDLYEETTDTWITNGYVSRGCGEIPLPNGGNCCLGSINLDKMYDPDKHDVDWKRLAKVIKVAVRFLDNVLTVNNYPIPLTKQVSTQSRRIGLGVMGLHYLLIKLGYKYGDEESLEFLERLFATIRNEAYLASIEIAKEKGAFPKFDAEQYLDEQYAKGLPQRIRHKLKKYGIRNAVLLTIPPTGTTSMIAEVSSGIEPIFAPVYKRSYRDPQDANVWKHTVVVDKLFQQFYNSDIDTRHIVGAYDVTPEEHLNVQATIQRFIDSSISKTINVPENIATKKLSDIMLEFIDDLKGVTIYRQNSRGVEPLKLVDIKDEKELQKIMAEANAASQSIDGCKSGSCEL